MAGATSAGFSENRFSAQDGLRLYYREYGESHASAAPVLCLPGITRNSRDFHEIAIHLAAARRVVCPDYRGRGRSAHDPDWRNYNPSVYVNDLVHLLAAVHLPHVVVIGTSLGGLLAMALAVAQPTSLAAVVLNDVGPKIEPAGLARILSFIVEDRPQPNWPAAVELLRAVYPTLGQASPQEWQRIAEGTFRQGDDGLLHFDWDVALARPLRRRSRIPDLWPMFRALRRIPTLAIRGALSDVFSVETLERMAREKPDLIQITISDAGHAPLLDRPRAQEAIDGFLARFRA